MSWWSKLKAKIRKTSQKGYNNYKASQRKSSSSSSSSSNYRASSSYSYLANKQAQAKAAQLRAAEARAKAERERKARIEAERRQAEEKRRREEQARKLREADAKRRAEAKARADKQKIAQAKRAAEIKKAFDKSKQVSAQAKRAAEIKKAFDKSKQVSALGTRLKTDTYKKKSGGIGKSTQLTSNDYLKMQNALRMPDVKVKGKSIREKAMGKDLAKKVSDRNVLDYSTKSAVMGAMEGLNPLPVTLDKMGAGANTKQGKKEIAKAKDSTAYKVGYGAGLVGSFGLGGTVSTGNAIAKGLSKGGAKTLAKATVKKAPKKLLENTDDVAKAVVKTGAKQAKKTATKITPKKFMANRAGDMIASTPLNISDSIKQGTDINGNVDWKESAKALALNTGIDFAVGGAIDVAAMGVKKITSSEFKTATKLMAKKKNGIPLSLDESQTLNKILTKAKKQASAKQNTVARTSVQIEPKNAPSKEIEPRKAPLNIKSADEVPVNAKTLQKSPQKVIKNAPLEQNGNVIPPKDVEKINANVEKMRSSGVSDDKIKTVLEKQGLEKQNIDKVVEPKSKIKEKIEANPKAQKEWQEVATKSFNAPSKQYDTVAKAIKSKNPQDIYKEALKGVSKEEVSKHAETLVKGDFFSTDELVSSFNKLAKDGKLGKVKNISHKEALAMAEAKADKDLDGLYHTVMNRDVNEYDTSVTVAEKVVLLSRLSDMAKANPKDLDIIKKLMEVTEVASTPAASNAGSALNAMKMFLRTTPEGRLRTMSRKVDNLNKQYGHRLVKGVDKLELTEDQITRILKADGEKEISKVINKIEVELFDQINATVFEKINEWRHFAMLFSPVTHIRNFLGNVVSKEARLMSDAIEIALQKALSKKLVSMGGIQDMVFVTKGELKKHEKLLNEEFDVAYPLSGSVGRYVENSRPNGSSIIKQKTIKKGVNLNYALLEAADMVIFRPEFRKNYIRYCKARDLDITKLTKKQIDEARDYSIDKAETATFRNSTKTSNFLVGAKVATATKKGKTPLGTALYRGGNIALESNFAFVKTPVNLFGRAVDFSPLSLVRATAELANAKSVDVFKAGIHHLSTGLTGTGIFALGAWLSNCGLITVETGKESGDAYYDRELGYQDYSLKINIGGKEYSWTLDWLAPMQSSLFMGAKTFENLQEKGFTLSGMLEGMSALVGPLIDMSFMSGTKDLFELAFGRAEQYEENGDKDPGTAVIEAIFGEIPQNYLDGLFPQLVSKAMQFLDPFQRDTSSTREDYFTRGWEKDLKQKMNKSFLRFALKPKLDRMGNPIKTGNASFLKFLNTFANPARVKEINITETDKELINIYKHLENGSKEKKYFFYNMTGRPNYDLGNGKRMTYDEAYKYEKVKKQSQWKDYKDMFASKSYKNMSWDMKAQEVGDYHWISQARADQNVYGSKFAADRLEKDPQKGKSIAERRKALKLAGGNDKMFVDFYVKAEKLISRSHDSDYNTKALAIALYGNNKLALAYDIHKDKVANAKKYLANGGSATEYSDAYCNIVSTLTKHTASDKVGNKAFAAAFDSINERTYHAMGISEQKANMGAGLKKFGYSFGSLEEVSFIAKQNYDFDGNGKLKKSEVIAYIDSLGIQSNAEKACLFEYLAPKSRNPYGRIPNYLNFGETDKVYSGGGRSYGRSYGSYGRGRKVKEPKTPKEKAVSMKSWESFVKDYISNMEKVSKVNFKDWNSPLNSSYKSKVKSILQKSAKANRDK